ncbi:(d)CMP kinase [Virgibacillus sp. W0181]|uniref:(d)CMP kinase n=1 Tax=Virgibacillus sp. W0181 TaxID=3391581 RepID=UPI003F44FF05
MKNDKKAAIAIDGPAAAGKSTVAKIVAKKLSFVYIDTGAMYRALTLKALTEKIRLDDEDVLSNLLKTTTIDLNLQSNGQSVLLDGKDVTRDIRNDQVSNNVSLIARSSTVRKEMAYRQKALSEQYSVVMDGRDIGTNVLPNADVKFFLVASVEERAKRRYEENLEKGFASNLHDLRKEIEKRDLMDTKREIAPLQKAADAIEIDTTSLSIDETAETIINEIRTKLKV